MANKFADFDLSDTTPAYISGDFFTKVEDKEEEQKVNVQIKRAGGSFKMAYSESYFKSRQDAFFLMFKENVSKVEFGSQGEFVNYYTRLFKEAEKKNKALANALEKGTKPKQDIETKLSIVKEYAKQASKSTQWYLFYIANSGSWSLLSSGKKNEKIKSSLGVESAILVNSKNLVKFVRNNPELFRTTLDKTEKGKAKSLSLVFTADNLTVSQYWKTGTQNLAFLVNPVESFFFAVRHHRKKSNEGEVETYMNYVKPGGITSDKFILAYESLFAPLKYK